MRGIAGRRLHGLWHGLNMIPGGFKGMRFLHEHRLTLGPQVSLKERDRAIDMFQRDNPRQGIPNLIISNFWKNEDHATRVICGLEGRIFVEQVKISASWAQKEGYRCNNRARRCPQS